MRISNQPCPSSPAASALHVSSPPCPRTRRGLPVNTVVPVPDLFLGTHPAVHVLPLEGVTINYVIISKCKFHPISLPRLPLLALRLKMTRSSTMLTVAGIAVGGLAAYAVYFDYKRRTDATFRRRLRMLVFVPLSAQN